MTRWAFISSNAHEASLKGISVSPNNAALTRWSDFSPGCLNTKRDTLLNRHKHQCIAKQCKAVTTKSLCVHNDSVRPRDACGSEADDGGALNVVQQLHRPASELEQALNVGFRTESATQTSSPREKGRHFFRNARTHRNTPHGCDSQQLQTHIGLQTVSFFSHSRTRVTCVAVCICLLIVV